MCGIFGFVHREPARRTPISEQALSRLAHRGPDGSGVFVDSYIQFGHTRLSIIDLSDAGHQPMLSHAGRYVVTYNGEIYNYVELRRELEALGQSFVSQSDTEVLLAAYHQWGSSCVERFRGMFAFVVWDTEKKTAFLARDRCGEKPLFYWYSGEMLIFASELKGLLPLLPTRPDLDVEAINQYLHYQYVPEPDTLLQGVHKLPAGHTLAISLESWTATPRSYWCVEATNDSPVHSTDPNERSSEILDALTDAVRMTLRSDVPVGIALSGGVDSGAIAVLAQKNYPEPMHAFCVGYPGRPHYDERAQARSLAESLGMIVHEVELPVTSFVDFFPELVGIMDEPIADPAAFGHYAVPRAAAEQGVKVLLSGIGGDEIFWGYPYTAQAVELNQLLGKRAAIAQLAKWLGSESAQLFLTKVMHYPHAHPTLKRWASILKKAADPRNPDGQLIYYMMHPDFAEPFDMKESVYGAAMKNITAASLFKHTDIGLRNNQQVPSAIIRLLFETWLTSNCLALGDRVSMAVGVETRMPFLDVRLIERIMSMRAQYPDHMLGSKVWLRAALKGVLPDEVLARPKAGFQPPLHDWLSGVVSKYGDSLRDGQLVKTRVLASNKIDYLLNTLCKKSWSGLFFTYKLVLLEQWYQKVLAV